MAATAHDFPLLRLLRFHQIGSTVANVASVAGVRAETAFPGGVNRSGRNRHEPL